MVRDRATSVIIDSYQWSTSGCLFAKTGGSNTTPGLDEASQTSTRCIKLPQRCMLVEAAHLIAQFRTNKVVNEAIKEGLVNSG